MKTILFTYLVFASLGILLMMTVYLSIFLSKKYPESKIDKFIRKHIIDEYTGNGF